MFRKLWKKIRGIFTSEVMVQRPNIPLNRHQRRKKAAFMRKRAKRKGHGKGKK